MKNYTAFSENVVIYIYQVRQPKKPPKRMMNSLLFTSDILEIIF